MKVRELGLAALALLAGCGGQPEETGAVVAAPTSGPSAASTSATPATSQAAACEAEETTIYVCTMQNGKALSVCSRGGDTATYRYGGSPPELVLQGGRWARVGYSGGGELQIAFDNGDTQYVVFGRTIRTGFDERGNNPVSSDGVVILRNKRFAGMQLCDPASDQSYYGEASEAAMQRLPQSEELFTDETIRADPPGNE